jgi:hypothetical protein
MVRSVDLFHGPGKTFWFGRTYKVTIVYFQKRFVSSWTNARFNLIGVWSSGWLWIHTGRLIWKLSLVAMQTNKLVKKGLPVGEQIACSRRKWHLLHQIYTRFPSTRQELQYFNLFAVHFIQKRMPGVITRCHGHQIFIRIDKCHPISHVTITFSTR